MQSRQEPSEVPEVTVGIAAEKVDPLYKLSFRIFYSRHDGVTVAAVFTVRAHQVAAVRSVHLPVCARTAFAISGTDKLLHASALGRPIDTADRILFPPRRNDG
jgi:hypothetical protein